MHWPFEIFIGLRYLRAKRRNSFISFISLISIVGIALGVAALIIVLSVMNGFQKEIRGRILSVAAHLEVSNYESRLNQWKQVAQLGQDHPHVLAAAPFVNCQGFFSAYGNVRGGLVRGIDPTLEGKVVDFFGHMLAGKLENLRPGEFGIVLGVELARQLNVGLLDKVILFVPQGTITPSGWLPRCKQFTVLGIFKAGISELDAALAMVHLRDAQMLSRMGDGVSGVRFKLVDPILAPTVKQALRAKLPENLVTDWTETNSNYLRAVQIEKRMMTIILTLIVAVAAFNLVSTLVMVVTDKQADIAILRTLGATPFSIMKIFMIQGSVAGVLGTLLGVVSGVLIAFNLDVIVPLIEHIIGSQILSSDVYMIDYLPFDVQWRDVSTVISISLLLAFFATLYPSWHAACTQPAEVLCYE